MEVAFVREGLSFGDGGIKVLRMLINATNNGFDAWRLYYFGPPEPPTEPLPNNCSCIRFLMPLYKRTYCMPVNST